MTVITTHPLALTPTPDFDAIAPARELARVLYADYDATASFDRMRHNRTSEDYARVLGLKERPVRADAKVLDVGTGLSQINETDLGVSPGRLSRMDIHTGIPGV